MTERLEHHDAEIFLVERIAEERVAAEGDGAEESAVNGYDGGATAGHGFDGGHAERFVATAEDEEIGGAVVVGEFVVGDEAGEFHAFFETQFFGESFQVGEDALLLRVHFFTADGEVEDDLGGAFGDEGEGFDEEIVALVGGETAEGEDGGLVEVEPATDHLPRGLADGEEAVVVVAGRDHVHALGGDAVVGGDHVELRGRGGDDEVARAVENRLVLDAFGEVELFFEGRFFLGVVGLHLLFFPETERVRRVDVRNGKGFGEALAGDAGVPVVGVDELVGELVFFDEAEGVFAPLHEIAVEVFLGDEFVAAAIGADDADAGVDDVDLGLSLEAARPDVHLVAELGEFFGELDHVNHLAAGVGGAEGGICGDVAVGGDHRDARAFNISV